MNSGIKIYNRERLLLYDSAWIAGVDYSEDDDYEDEFENESGNEEYDDTESSDILTENGYIVNNVDLNEVGNILEDPNYNAREEDQDKPIQNDRGSLVEQVENFRNSWIDTTQFRIRT